MKLTETQALENQVCGAIATWRSTRSKTSYIPGFTCGCDFHRKTMKEQREILEEMVDP